MLSLVAFEWDPTLYAGSARFYRKGRLPYAPGMTAAIHGALELTGDGRLLDVGCGPGIVALELASRLEEVVGVDADPDMISEAQEETRRRGVTNARWVNLRAEDLPAGLGSFRVATFAQSFHWMQRERVARTTHDMLEPMGGLVHINAYTRTGIDATTTQPFPLPPWDAIAELVRTYLGSETRAGQGRRDAQLTGPDEILGGFFDGPEVVTVPDGRVLTRTEDQVVASVYSVSSSSPHLFEERLVSFESELHLLLRQASPTGLFSQQTGDTELRIWRPRRSSSRA